MDEEIIKTLEELGLYPIPDPKQTHLFVPDYLNQVATPFTIGPAPPGDTTAGEYLYEAPDNGYVSVIGIGSCIGTGNNSIQITTEISGILFSAVALTSTVPIYFSTEWLLVEKATVTRTVFTVPEMGMSIFSSLFAKFIPLKKLEA